MRRFGRGEKAKDNIEMATGFVVVMPAMLLVMVLLIPALFTLELKYFYFAGPAILLPIWFLIQRYVDRTFVTEYEAIYSTAVEIVEDPSRGPGWALRRQMFIGLGALLLFGVAVVLMRLVAVRLDLVANPDQFQELATLSAYHRANESDLDKFADQFEQNENLVAVACGTSLMQLRKAGSGHFEPMTDEYREMYSPLCQFSSNISAQRTSRGIRFPHSLYEQGHLLMYAFLERRRSKFDFDQKCNSEALTMSSGNCDVPLDSRWAVTYSWEPFCTEDLGPDAGCE